MIEEQYTVDDLVLDIKTVIGEAETLPPGRELSLVITKLQEALHWAKEIPQ